MYGKKFRKKFISKARIISVLFIIVLIMSTHAESYAVEYKFNMSYIFFGDPEEYSGYVENAGRFDEISPSYFDIKSDGSLEITDKLDMDFINTMHNKGIKVVPLLSNHWNREAGRIALNNRHVLSQNIAQAVLEYNLDGVHVDIENVTEDDRDNYTDFIRLLRENLPEGSIIAVAVAANPRNLVTGWHGSYDYKALSEYSDYLMIMTYDEHCKNSISGPIASISFVEDSIDYALKRVSPEKIVLGIPLYGRYWKEGVKSGGYGMNLTDVEVMADRYGAEINYDKYIQSPEAIISIETWEDGCKVFGNQLTAGTYHIWYENEESIKRKLELVQKYDLKGAGSWSLGQETKETWDFFNMWLNGCYYSDVEGHWAQDEIVYVSLMSWMNGYSDEWFAANESLTRAETAAIFVRILGFEIKEEDIQLFDDINGHWAVKEINTAAENEIIMGVGDRLFEPDRPITRQEIAVMLDRIITGEFTEETDGESEPYFSDVEQESCSWSYDSIISMSRQGIFKGYSDGTFRPFKEITRAEM